MAYTQRQLDALLSPDLIPASRMPHRALRIAESEIKRRLIALEDRAALRLYRLYADVYRALREDASELAERHGVTTLAQDRASNDWRNVVLDTLQDRVQRLTDDVAAEGLRSTVTAYTGAYAARLWLLDVATTADVRIDTAPPALDALYRSVLQPMLKEDEYDSLVQSLLGQEWRSLYADELAELTLRIRRAINAGMTGGESIAQLMRRVREAMGVETDRRRIGNRGNFNRVQVITRTYVNRASNQATVEAYRRNGDILDGYQWVTAKDERACPACLALDGTTYKLSDSVRPPEHPNCRCTVVGVIRDDALVPDDEPPRETLRSWVVRQGLEDLVLAFVGSAVRGSV